MYATAGRRNSAVVFVSTIAGKSTPSPSASNNAAGLRLNSANVSGFRREALSRASVVSAISSGSTIAMRSNAYRNGLQQSISTHIAGPNEAPRLRSRANVWRSMRRYSATSVTPNISSASVRAE